MNKPAHVRVFHGKGAAVQQVQSQAAVQSPAQKQSQPRAEQPVGTVISGSPTTYDPIIGAAQTRSAYGVDGSGMTVAVIDTGVDYKHSALGGSFGPGAKVVAGYNFSTNTADPMATASQHGTAVAGLIGSSDPSHLGVAPGVDIVALRVVGDNNSADLSNIARALQWVIDHRTEYGITAVNLSLSDGGNYAQNWFAQDGGVGQQITDLVHQLTMLKIPVISATGNSFNGQQGEGFTSIVSDTISVTATDQNDQLLPNAQRLGTTIGMGSGTDLAAPGSGSIAPSGDDQYASVEGTSFAAPLVTGAVVLLQQIYQARFGTLPTVDQVTQWLEKGADPIHDQVTGINLGRLDITKAASLVPGRSTTTSTSTVGTPAAQEASWLPPTPAPPVSTPATPSVPSSPVVTAPAPVPVSVPSRPSQGNPTPSTPPQPSRPAPVLSTPDVKVYINGKPLGTNTANPTSMLTSLTQSRFDELVKAMSDWAASDKTHGGSPSAVSQVRIWNAQTQTAAGVTLGAAYPSGSLLAVMARRFRRGRR